MIAELVLAVTTFANPLDVSYGLRTTDGKTFREAADPEIVTHAGRHWLFASMCGRYFVSDDLAVWKGVESKDLPFEEYAPTVEEIGGALHFTARGGTVHRAVDLLSGVWERLPKKVRHTVDSALFRDDDGRLYVYWGGSDSKHPLFAVELDPQTFADRGKGVRMLEENSLRYGWEVRGHRNEITNRLSYIEGSHMAKRDGVYYFQYASPGTQFDTYSDTAMIGSAPLGPFVRQKLNPFSLKTSGYVTSAGHGKTFQDKVGNWWHVTTGLVGNEFFTERRLVMFPVFFDGDGEMWCDTAFSDWPIVVPDHKTDDPNDYHTGWMPLTYGKRVTASSAFADTRPEAVVDESIRTFWSAVGSDGEWLEVDLGGPADVCSIQLGFVDAGDVEKLAAPSCRRYRVELRTGPDTWTTALKEEQSCETEQPYRMLKSPVMADRLRVTCLSQPQGTRFALREVRAFGRMDKPVPARLAGLSVIRDAADRRRAKVSWLPSAGATGYVLRYGPSPDKMHLSRLVRGSTAVELRSLDSEQEYSWAVSAFNEAGLSSSECRSTDRRAVVHEVDGT